jgi:hypothetical protein
VGTNIQLIQSNSVVLGNNANVGIGTSTPATKLDVNGSLRLTVRLCPANGTGAYPINADDLAYSIFKTQDGNTVGTVVLPPASGGQVVGQEMTIYNRASTSVIVNAANTDNSLNGVTLVGSGTVGIHAVKYIWDGAWIRVQ